MGLDLYHVIPTKKTEKTNEYFMLYEFEDNLDFLEKHNHLIEEIDDYDFELEILVFSDIEIKTLVLENHEDYKNKPSLVGDFNNLWDEIMSFTIGHNISEKEPLVLKSIDNLLTQKHKKEIYYHSIYFTSKTPKKIKVLFWEIKGYQRKGMNANFYKDFINDENYYDIKTVYEAALYLQPTWGNSGEELEKSFKASFIDNFIEGESIFFASW
jgi:hypothetical protein